MGQDWSADLKALAGALAEDTPAPGGGAAAAAAGALGCALGRMAAAISGRGKKADEERRGRLCGLGETLAGLQARLEVLASEDAQAFEGVMAVLKAPKDAPGRAERLQQAFASAAEAPLRTARTAAEAAARIREGSGWTLGTVGSDMRCAAHLLRCAVLCALENVEVNLPSIKNPDIAGRLREETSRLREGCLE